MTKTNRKIHLAFDPYLILTILLVSLKVYILIEANSINIFRGVMLFNIGIILLMIAPAYCLTNKYRKVYLYICNFILTFLLLSDQLYFRYFGSPISMQIINQAANLSGLGPSVLALCKWIDIIYIIDLIILPFVFFNSTLQVVENRRYFLREFFIGAVIIIIIINMNYLDGRIFTRYSSKDTLRFWGPLGYHVMDTAYFIKDRNMTLTPSLEKKILNWYEKKNLEENQTSFKNGAGEGKNLIVIQLESFQNFVIGLKINDQEITPNLNKLVKNSIYFPHYYPQTVKGNSSDAELLSNASVYPIKEGSTFFKYSQNKYFSLPSLLKDRGYQTLVIHGDEAEYWNRDKVYPNLGFPKYYSEEKMEITDNIGMGLSDESMFRQSISILKNTPKPFYSFIITLTSHHPFWLPGDKVSLTLPSPLSQSHLGNYLRSINYTDKALGQFIQGLQDEGLLQDTVIALYGDHDGLFKRDKEEIENLLANKKISEEEWIRTYVPVPLLIYSSEQEGKTMDVFGGQVDFLPTIGSYMGLKTGDYKYAMGDNLLSSKDSYVIIPRGDYITQDICISKDKIETDLRDIDVQTLDIADIIIRTNFFEHVK